MRANLSSASSGIGAAAAVLAAVSVVQPLVALTVIGLAAAVVVIRTPTLGLLFLAVLLPFTDVISALLGGGGKATAFGGIKDGLLLLLLIGASLSRRPVARVPVTLVACVVAIQLLAIPAALRTENASQAIYGWRNELEPFLLLLAVPRIADPAAIRRITLAMTACVQVSAAIGIATWSLGFSWLTRLKILPVAAGARFPAEYFTAGNNRVRAFSPYVSPNEMAAATAVVLVVIWCRRDWTFRRRVLLSILPLTVELLSRSRSGVVGVLVVLAVLVLWKFRTRSTTAGLLVFTWLVMVSVAGLILLLPRASSSTDPSIVGHAASIQASVADLLSHPLGFGLGTAGPRAFRYTDNPHLAENSLLVLGLGSGLLVLLLVVALLAAIVHESFMQRELLRFMPFAALAAVSISILTLPTLTAQSVSFTLWLVVGMGLASPSSEMEAHVFSGRDCEAGGGLEPKSVTVDPAGVRGPQ